MKVLIISDTHYGIKNDSISLLDNNKIFLDNQFFPFIEKNNITHVIHLGDIVDRRKHINFYTLKRLKEDFLDRLCDKNIKLDLICGNHDTYFKNTNSVNSLNLLFKEYENIHIYIDTQEVEVLGFKILYIPWVCKENEDDSFEKIKKTRCQIAMGHLEISGFPMYVGSPLSHGFDMKLFSKFDMVLTGHFHHRSSKNNIHYVGSHSEFFWSDWNDPRGFHILDLSKRELEFIANKYTIYEKFYYDNTNIQSLQEDKFKNKFLKIVVKNKDSEFEFDKFIEKVESFSPIDYQIIDDVVDIEETQQNNIEIESTIDICKNYIENIDSKNVDKKELEKKLIEIYNEAIDKE